MSNNLRAALVAAALLLLANCGGSAFAEPAAATAPTEGKTVEIGIDNFAFTPPEITIAPGTTVRWVNHDDIPHQVAEAGGAFKSKPLDTDESFSTSFEKPGEVDYFCTLHPHMTGKIIVRTGAP
jgi:plastocyanin